MPGDSKMAESPQTPGDSNLLQQNTGEPEPCERLPVGQMDRKAIVTVEEIHRACSKSIQTDLAELLQTPVTAGFHSSAQSRISEALNAASPEHRAIRLDLSPLEGFGYLVFPTALLFRVLDILLATPENTHQADTAWQPPRCVTAIEIYILREFFEVFAKSLRAAWAPVYPAAFSQSSPHSDDEAPASPEVSDGSAIVLNTAVELAGLNAEVLLILPTFLARMAHLKSDEESGRDGGGQPSGGIIQCLGSAYLSMDVILQGASIRIRDLLAMAPGQIVAFGNAEESPFECLVNGRQQFAGTLVPGSSQCSLRIDYLAGEPQSHLDSGGSLDR
jgi:flagellar motor switch protein FliM